MKRMVIFVAAALLVLSCTTSPEKAAGPGSEGGIRGGDPSPSEERVPEVEEMLERWQQALRDEDLDLFLETYWPDARLDVLNEDGTSDTFIGTEAIRENQRRLFEGFDFSGFEFPPFLPHRRGPGPERAVYRIEYEWGQEFFVFMEREGQWRIQAQEFINQVPGAWITSRFQAAADLNGNGFLDNEEPEEHQVLVNEILRPLLYDPHDVRNIADELFDGNRDGFIDEREIERVRGVLFFENVMYLAGYSPEQVAYQYDLNEDGQIRPEEAEQVMEFLFGNPVLREPRRAETDLDRRIDINEDGQVDQEEIDDRSWHFIHMAGSYFFRDEVLMDVPRDVTSYLDRIADENGDGMVDEREHEMLTGAMEWERRVESYIGWKLDANKNRYLDLNEILLARQTYAMGREVDLKRAEPPFAAETFIDRILDLNRNGRVEQDEINEVVFLLAAEEPDEDAPEWAMELFDHNRDGIIELQERENSKWFFIFPHPVDPDSHIDRELDRNRDGFIDPGEMGITAGMTDKGETATFAERIESARWTGEFPETEMTRTEETGTQKDSAAESRAKDDRSFESEYYKKLGTIQDKKLAIVGLSMGTATVNQETANGLIVFVENAFVNIGKVRVVDRKNIEQIMEEYKFQASAMTDESTAVEIGKLSGADIIVIGSINFVGKRYYLNIKLINVETGEIIGSSIAEALDESRFLDMSNKAVYNLF